mgnify:FL=1
MENDNREKIHIQNTTFESEYGYVVEWRSKSVLIELTYKEDSMHFPKGTKFNRSFSRKTGLTHKKSFGKVLKILP